MNDLSNETMADWLKDLADQVRRGEREPESMPLSVYSWLDNIGRIPLTADDKRAYLVLAADRRLGQLIAAVECDNSEANRRQLRDFAGMRRRGEFTGSCVEQLKDLAKKMILFDMLQDPGQPAGQQKQNSEGKVLEMSQSL